MFGSDSSVIVIFSGDEIGLTETRDAVRSEYDGLRHICRREESIIVRELSRKEARRESDIASDGEDLVLMEIEFDRHFFIFIADDACEFCSCLFWYDDGGICSFGCDIHSEF